MKICNVVIRSFMGIQNAHINVENKGLVLIQGENRDDTSTNSNGAGKSTVPDAICWALFGTTARGLSGDAVVNKTVGKGCFVAVYLDDGGEHYEVLRHRKSEHNKNRLIVRKSTAGSSWDDISKGTDAETQKLVTEILGCSYEVFTSAVYAGQEAMPDLPNMTDKQLKVLVEEAAGIDRIQRAYEASRDRLNKAKMKTQLNEVKLEGLKKHIEAANQTIKETEELSLKWEESRKHDVAELTKKFSEAREATLRLKPLYKEEDHKALEAKLAELNARIEGQQAERDTERDLELKASKLKSEAEYKHLPKVKSLASECERVAAQIEGLKSSVGTPCSECGRPYTEHEIEPTRKRLQAALEKKEAEHVAAKQESVAALQSAESVSKRLKKFRESMTDLSEVISLKRDTERQIDDLKAQHRLYVEKRDLAKTLAHEVQRRKEEASPYTELQKLNKAKLKDLTGEKKELEKKMASQKKDIEVLESVVSIFGPAGIRAHILDEVTPYLNRRTAEYLSALSDGNITATWSTIGYTAKGEAREKFHISVMNATGGDSFTGLSGGEKRKVRLSTAMALQDLVAQRATKPIELFIADEVDHALDESGLERLMIILDEKARTKGTVLVISHNSLSDWIREQATVIKEGGTSYIEGVLNR